MIEIVTDIYFNNNTFQYKKISNRPAITGRKKLFLTGHDFTCMWAWREEPQGSNHLLKNVVI
jgi:hypothetical protein